MEVVSPAVKKSVTSSLLRAPSKEVEDLLSTGPPPVMQVDDFITAGTFSSNKTDDFLTTGTSSIKEVDDILVAGTCWDLLQLQNQ